MKILRDRIFLILFAVVVVIGAMFFLEIFGLYPFEDVDLLPSSVVIVADLVEVKGGIPTEINYNYVFLMKYMLVEVLKGSPDLASGGYIWVGHKNPDAARFVVGKRYTLAVEPHLFEVYDGGVVDRYQDNPWVPYSPFLAID